MTLDFNNVTPLETTEARTKRVREQVLSGRLEDLLRHIYGQNVVFKGYKSARIGNINGDPGESLSIALQGHSAGLWKEFADNGNTIAQGDFIHLWRHIFSQTHGEAVKDIDQWLNGKVTPQQIRNTQKQAAKPKPRETYEVEAESYAYHTVTGEHVYDVVRFNKFYEDTGEPVLNSRGRPRKEYKPRRPGGTSARLGYPPGLRLLYRLPDIEPSDHVILCEGEKAADAVYLAGFPATSAPGGSNTDKDKIDWRPLAGKTVTLWPDNDDEGRKFMAECAELLTGLGCTVRTLEVPGIKQNGDAADLDDDEIRALLSDDEAVEQLEVSGFDGIVPEPRPWVYAPLLLRGFVSLIAAPPGTGKTTFSIQLAACFAMGKGYAGCVPDDTGPVLLVNGEEPEEEIKRRFLAACHQHKFDPAEVAPRLRWYSGYSNPIRIAEYSEQSRTAVATHRAQQIVDAAKAMGAKLIVVDPVIELHGLEENDNNAQAFFGSVLRRIAEASDCAVLAFTHTPKGVDSTRAGDPYVVRGGGSLVGVARVVGTLFTMGEADADRFGIERDKRFSFTRFDLGKANMSSLTSEAVWFKKTVHRIASGDDVAVLAEHNPDQYKSDKPAMKSDWELFVERVKVDLPRVLEDQGGSCSIRFYSENANHTLLGFKERSVREKIKILLEEGPLQTENGLVKLNNGRVVLCEK